MENKVEIFKVSMSTKEGDCCPECNENWDGGDILEAFKNMRDDTSHKYHKYYVGQTDEELIKAAGLYGWSEETPKRFGNVIGVELSLNDPEHYDGISYYQCPGCNIAWNRWDGKRTERFVKPIENQKIGKKKLKETQEEAQEEAERVRNNKSEEDTND